MIIIGFKTSALRIGSLHLTYSAVLCWIRLRGTYGTYAWLFLHYFLFFSFSSMFKSCNINPKDWKEIVTIETSAIKNCWLSRILKRYRLIFFKFWTHACNVLHCFNQSILLLNSPCMRSCSYLASWSEGDDFLTPTNQTCSLVKREMIGPCTRHCLLVGHRQTQSN